MKILIFVLLVATVAKTGAIDCYVCSSLIVNTCPETDPDTSSMTTIGCSHKCFKLVIATGVTRGCLNTGVHVDTPGLTTCDSDLCNTASGQNVSYTTLMFNLMLAISMFLFVQIS